VVWKLDRLGRDLRHLVNTVEDLRARGVLAGAEAGPPARKKTMSPQSAGSCGPYCARAVRNPSTPPRRSRPSTNARTHG
jgi:hypothetical protein